MKLRLSTFFTGKIIPSLLLLIGLSACTALLGRTVTPIPTARPTDLGAALVTQPTYPPLTYGIQTFLWWNSTTRPRDLEMVRLMNFTHVKQIFAWESIQGDQTLPPDWSHADAVVNEVAYRGLKLIARVESPPSWALNQPGTLPLDLKAWGIFCHDLAARYVGRIAGYEIWNEPNLTGEWFKRTPNARDYVTLLKTCYTQMKAADPNAIIISAGLAPTGDQNANAIRDDVFLQQMYDAGLANAYDVLGLHAPGYKSPPDTDPADPALGGQRWQSFRHVEDMRAIQVANHEGAKQDAILEMGWTLDTIHPVYSWFHVTEAQQAKYLVGAYAYAAAHWRPWMGLMTTIYLPDFTWTEANEQYWWSIALPGYATRVRQAYTDLANMEKISGSTIIPARDAGLAATDNTGPLPPPSVTP